MCELSCGPASGPGQFYQWHCHFPPQMTGLDAFREKARLPHQTRHATGDGLYLQLAAFQSKAFFLRVPLHPNSFSLPFSMTKYVFGWLSLRVFELHYELSPF